MTAAAKLEIGEVFRRHGQAYLACHGQTLSYQQRQAVRDLAACRTAALGGHVLECDHCGEQHIVYNSCRNRHCPTCQGGSRAAWLEREASFLLPTEYHHVVFTLPAEVADLALSNRKVVYDLLFRAASETLREVAADRKHLGAQLGVVAVLHTWGQNLQHHPHLHCVVSGGGLTLNNGKLEVDKAEWVSCRPGFFLPVKVLSRVYRGKFLAYLHEAFAAGLLVLAGAFLALPSEPAWQAWLRGLYQKDWVVYAKPPFAGAEVVLKYLARYTNRVAISNARLVSLGNDEVTFEYKDYARGGKKKLLTLSAEEFIRRFLLHVLPKGFVKVRHYGLLANAHREGKLKRCRELLKEAIAARQQEATRQAEKGEGRPHEGDICPACGQGRLRVVEVCPRRSSWAATAPQEDTS